MNPDMTVIAVFAVLAAAAAILISCTKKKQEKEIKDRIKNSWGSDLSQLYSVEEIKRIRVWSDSGRCLPGEPGFTEIDDITSKDIDLDRVFTKMDHTVSSPGSEVLYSWLRHPLTNPDALRERIRIEDYFTAHEEERNRVREILVRIGRLKKMSFAASILSLGQAEPIGRSAYLALSVITAALFVLLFVFPLAAVAGLIPVLFLDFRIHLAMKDRTAPYIAGFQAVWRLLEASSRIVSLDIPEISGISREMKELASSFSGFRRRSFLLTSGGSVGTGIADAVLEYIRMFFHVDLISFDAMLGNVRGHIDEACMLLDRVGSLDALIASASYMKSCAQVCRPEFETETNLFEAEGLVHPLLLDPVPNSVRTGRSILLTGSNASGKSTFLRSAALAALTSQSIGAVSAVSYRAPMYRVFSSMALEDNLSGGESYFVVEIRSLKRILDAAAKGGAPVLAVIDEVLRGTNTTERIAASSQILKALDEAGALVIAATHDGELTGLLGDIFRNMHFAENVSGGDVSFDYILREGPSDGRNAIRLLAESGFDPEITEAAERRAGIFETTGEWKL